MIGDQRKVPAELDDSGQLPIFHECATDGLGSRFIDAEHARSMRTLLDMGNRKARDCAPHGAPTTGEAC